MKKLTKTLGATLVIAIISATSFATIASAHGQNNRFGPNAERNQGQHNGGQFRGPRDRGGFLPLRLVCSDRGEVRIENALSRIAERIDLSGEQTTALDNFKQAALSAQSAFNQVCEDFKPGKGADLIDRMKSRQAAIAAQLVGVQSIMPTFEVFFDSLSERQKAKLRPHMRPRQGMGPNMGPNMGPKNDRPALNPDSQDDAPATPQS